MAVAVRFLQSISATGTARGAVKLNGRDKERGCSQGMSYGVCDDRLAVVLVSGTAEKAVANSENYENDHGGPRAPMGRHADSVKTTWKLRCGVGVVIALPSMRG